MTQTRVFIVLSVLTAFFALTETARAIPAFSRQYNTECSTCHTIYPELNEFGDAFYKNSFVWPNAKTPAKKEEKAEDAAKGGKREAMWLSGIPEYVPVSLSAGLNFIYDEDAPNRYDLNTRFLTLHAGGAFRDKAGFFVTFNAYSQGTSGLTNGTVPHNNGSDIGELFVQWRHAFDTPINIKAGRIEPKLSLWKSTDRVTPTFFAPLNYTVGKSPFRVDAPEDGLEANTVLGNRVFVAGGVVNRKGQDTKEGYGHISVKIGGTDFLGHEPEVDFENDSIWDYLSVTLGAFAYFGRDGELDSNGVAFAQNNFYRAGTEMDLLYKRFRIKTTAVKGRDNNPLLSVSGSEKQDSLVVSSEAEFLFGSQLIAATRYEYQNDDIGITQRIIPVVAFAPLQNTKLQLQYLWERVGATSLTPVAINRTAQFNIVFSF